MTEINARKLLLYIGTYTRSGGEGIYAAHLDTHSGRLSQPVVAAKTANPSFLAIHPNTRTLYAVNELERFAGAAGGAVSAYRMDATTGHLSLLNQQPTRGAAPCYVSVDATGQAVLVANYGGGNVTVYSAQADGSLSAPTDTVQHEVPHPGQPRQAHAHSIDVTPDNRCALVADLGLDKVMIYELDPFNGKLAPHDPPFFRSPPGAGPRHFVFHPSGRFFYVIHETASSVSAYSYDAGSVDFTCIQTIATLPEDWCGENACADIHLSPSGRFLYGSNRGHDSIVIFEVDAHTGALSRVGNESTGGRTPRNFAIDPSGTFLLAANQDSNNIVILTIDVASGLLNPTGIEVDVPMPVCLAFHPDTP